MKSENRYFLFLAAILVLSIPFYIWGAQPVTTMPLGALGLHLVFLMIFVPFFLALFGAWSENKLAGIAHLFQSVLDFKAVRLWPLLFAGLCMPIATGLAFLGLKFAGLVPETTFPYKNIPVMALFFLGAIPEEAAWTYTLTSPLSRRYGPVAAGTLIGGVWALWHVIPWGWTYSASWVAGMSILTILMRIGMVHNYMHGGKSLFLALLFHMQTNICITLLGPAFHPWLTCIGMLLLDMTIIGLTRRVRLVAINTDTI